MAAQTEQTSPKQALIFIPDISGFTQFVSDTEISHSKHIIQELLEILIDTNLIGLEVSEIEGDAILFYRFGNAPSSELLLKQVKEMYTRFHLHLKKYESHRICNCGACRTANNLTIKFIAHYGDISMNSVKQYKKLFGKELIVAHRLLKNDIESNEYSLFTDHLKEATQTWKDIESQAWTDLQHASKEYDCGHIQFSYLPLDPLMKQLPEIAPEEYGLQGEKSKMLVASAVIDVPIDLVFDIVSDIPWRSKWIPGSLEVVADVNTQLTQEGQTHRCLAKGPVMVGHSYHREKNTITFTETATNGMYSVVYTFVELEPSRTQFTLSMFMPKHAIKEFMFNLIMRKKLQKGFTGCFENLNQYCAGLLARGERHPYSVSMPAEKEAIRA